MRLEDTVQPMTVADFRFLQTDFRWMRQGARWLYVLSVTKIMSSLQKRQLTVFPFRGMGRTPPCYLQLGTGARLHIPESSRATVRSVRQVGLCAPLLALLCSCCEVMCWEYWDPPRC